MITSNVFDSFPNLNIPVLLPALTELPTLTFVVPLSDTISTDVFASFLIETSKPGIAVPIPTLPVFNDVNAVPPVPTLISVDAVVTPELISPDTSPVKLPVTLPVTFPVNAPSKLVDVVTPVTSSPAVLNVAAVPTLTKLVTDSCENVDTPDELIFPVTLPVKLPVTLPVTAPVKSPVTLPTTLPVNAPTKLVAVILPIELIPTPILPVADGSPPTWKLCLGSVVAIPTLPIAYIEVNPKPKLTSSHCDVGRFDNVEPSPLNDVAVITPLLPIVIALPT